MNRLPTHPGEVLREEFLRPLKLSAADLGRGINAQADRVIEILHGERSVTVDTAIRLARFFRTSARFWLNLQTIYDLAVAEAANPHAEIMPWRTHFHAGVTSGLGLEADSANRRGDAPTAVASKDRVDPATETAIPPPIDGS